MAQHAGSLELGLVLSLIICASFLFLFWLIGFLSLLRYPHSEALVVNACNFPFKILKFLTATLHVHTVCPRSRPRFQNHQARRHVACLQNPITLHACLQSDEDSPHVACLQNLKVTARMLNHTFRIPTTQYGTSNSIPILPSTCVNSQSLSSRLKT